MPTEWPSRFIYVCNASRAALVNVLPLLHAGLHRVERVVVFCGAQGPNEPDANNRAEALDPALRLERSLDRWTSGKLSRARGGFEIRYGRPTHVADWQTHMRSIVDSSHVSSQPNLPILYNIKAGTKEMAIGGVLGSALAGDGVMNVTISDQLPRVELIGDADQQPLPAAGGGIDLSRYLEIYGFQEHVDTNPNRAYQQRATFEALCVREKDRIEAFVAAFMPNVRDNWFMLQHLTSDLQPRDDTPFMASGPIGLQNPAQGASKFRLWNEVSLARAMAALDGFPGLEITRNGDGACRRFRVADQNAARFLRGGWVEAKAYLALKDAMKDRKDITIAGSLGLSPEDRPLDRETEIDVAVLIGSQLLIVEAKASMMTSKASSKSSERSLPQVDSNKRMLLGQVGKALIVNPCVTAEHLKDKGGAIVQRARRSGLELFLGPAAIDQMVEYVRVLAMGGTPAPPTSRPPPPRPQSGGDRDVRQRPRQRKWKRK